MRHARTQVVRERDGMEPGSDGATSCCVEWIQTKEGFIKALQLMRGACWGRRADRLDRLQPLARQFRA